MPDPTILINIVLAAIVVAFISVIFLRRRHATGSDLPRNVSAQLAGLEKQLRSFDEAIRRRAVIELSTIKAARAIQLLEIALNDEYRYVRAGALTALRLIGTPEAIKSLVAIFLKPSNPDDRNLALFALKGAGWEPVTDEERSACAALQMSRAVKVVAIPIPGDPPPKTTHGGSIQEKWVASEPPGGIIQQPEDILTRIQSAVADENYLDVAQLRSGLAIDPLLRSLFEPPKQLTRLRYGGMPKYYNITLEETLFYLTSFSQLKKEWIEWIIQSSRYEYGHYLLKQSGKIYSLEQSDKAVQALCNTRSPVTSNVLHLIANKKDVIASVLEEEGSRRQEVNFGAQRQKALAELKKRGSPPYQPVAYLLSAEAKRLDAASVKCLSNAWLF